MTQERQLLNVSRVTLLSMPKTLSDQWNSRLCQRFFEFSVIFNVIASYLQTLKKMLRSNFGKLPQMYITSYKKSPTHFYNIYFFGLSRVFWMPSGWPIRCRCSTRQTGKAGKTCCTPSTVSHTRLIT